MRADLTIASTTLSTRLVRNCDFDLDFRNKAHGIFGAAIDLGMPLLMPKAVGLGYGHAGDAGLRQGIPHIFELKRLG